MTDKTEGVLPFRLAVALGSPREPLTDLAARRREMLRPRSHRERGVMTDWQWAQIQEWERNFYSVALAKAARPCREIDLNELAAIATKCGARAETIRGAQ